MFCDLVVACGCFRVVYVRVVFVGLSVMFGVCCFLG